MKYSDNYKDIFSAARYAIKSTLLHQYNHIRECNKEGVHVSIFTISYIADNLTAYNELLPIQSFISFKIITE